MLAITAILGGMGSRASSTPAGAIRSRPGITFTNRLVEARTQALKRNRPIDVTLDAAAGTLRTTYTPPGGAAIEIGGAEYLPSGVVFEVGDGASLVVTFDSMGRPFNPPQTFRLRHTGSGQLRTISVLSTGRVT